MVRWHAARAAMALMAGPEFGIVNEMTGWRRGHILAYRRCLELLNEGTELEPRGRK